MGKDRCFEVERNESKVLMLNGLGRHERTDKEKVAWVQFRPPTGAEAGMSVTWLQLPVEVITAPHPPCFNGF